MSFRGRVAARAWRGRVEETVDSVLASRELARLIDRALAGPLPEEVARSLVKNRVIDRIAAELAASGELDRLVTEALASRKTVELTDRVLASEEMQHAIGHIASSPELREAIERQTVGFAEEIVGELRASASKLDDRAEEIVRRRPRTAAPIYAGIATRAIALTIDVGLATVLLMALTGVISLISSLVGKLRPEWLVGTLLGSGWLLLSGAYFLFFWSTTGHTPGMRLLRLRARTTSGAGLSVGRSFVRLIGLALSIIPLFAGFLPVLFTTRRRGLHDFLAGTVVVYDRPATSGPRPET